MVWATLPSPILVNLDKYMPGSEGEIKKIHPATLRKHVLKGFQATDLQDQLHNL